MKKSPFFICILVVTFGVFLVHTPFAKAENPDANAPQGAGPSAIKSELPPSPVRDAILKLLQPEELFKTLQKYISVPLPGTGVKEVQINKGDVTELNRQVNTETGVDIIKFLQFIGKLMVIILESIARLIRGLLAGSSGG